MKQFPEPSPNFLYSIVIVIARTCFRIFYRHRVYGREHVVPGAAILAANHASFLDPPILSTSVYDQVFFLARKSLFRGLFGRFIYALNARPVSGEGAGDVRVFREIEEVLKAGGKLILFPEGTRSESGEIGPIKGGLSIIVAKTGCAVIPAYLYGTGKIWGRDRKFPKIFGKTACIFGTPVTWDKYSSLEKKAAQAQFAEDLRNSILALKQWYESGAHGTPP